MVTCGDRKSLPRERERNGIRSARERNGCSLEKAREGGVIGAVDTDATSRMLVGAPLTYAIYDGLLVGDRPPRPPEPERIEGVVDLFMKTTS